MDSEGKAAQSRFRHKNGLDGPWAPLVPFFSLCTQFMRNFSLQTRLTVLVLSEISMCTESMCSGDRYGLLSLRRGCQS